MTSKHIVITGATGAIGSALAYHYAAPGVQLYLLGRNPELLLRLAEQCSGRGAVVVTQSLDLTDRAGLSRWCEEVLKPVVPDLVFANAGINIDTGINKQGESWEDTEQLLELNIRATFFIAHYCARLMKQRRRGHLVLVSSLAAWFGLPVTPAYSASKAALKAYGEGLRGWLHGSGVKVSVVMPGYVQSPMCAAMPGPKPFTLTPAAAAAARRIARGVAAGAPRISFPFPLNWGCWWLAVLPARVSHALVRWMGYGG